MRGACEPPPLFTGRRDFLPLYRAFISAQQAELTGVLRLHMQERVLLCYLQSGRPVLITTHDADAYFATPYPFTPKQATALEAAMNRQREDATPIFLTLAAQSLPDTEPLGKLCRDYGARLLSKAWTGGRFTFEFEALERLPEISGPLKTSSDGMDQWMIESPRHVGDEALSAISWGDLGGVPMHTRHGYEPIQHITLTREEAVAPPRRRRGQAEVGRRASRAMPPNARRRHSARWACSVAFAWPAERRHTPR